MRVFVTAAQDAAMRTEISHELSGRYAQVVSDHRAQHEREIARLRADREQELARLTDLGPVITYLREEVDFWRTAFRTEQERTRHEQQRAEISIDQCRAAHGNVGPATVAPMPATLSEMERLTARDVPDNPVLAGMGGLGLG